MSVSTIKLQIPPHHVMKMRKCNTRQQIPGHLPGVDAVQINLPSHPYCAERLCIKAHTQIQMELHTESSRALV